MLSVDSSLAVWGHWVAPSGCHRQKGFLPLKHSDRHCTQKEIWTLPARNTKKALSSAHIVNPSHSHRIVSLSVVLLRPYFVHFLTFSYTLPCFGSNPSPDPKGFEWSDPWVGIIHFFFSGLSLRVWAWIIFAFTWPGHIMLRHHLIFE